MRSGRGKLVEWHRVLRSLEDAEETPSIDQKKRTIDAANQTLLERCWQREKSEWV